MVLEIVVTGVCLALMLMGLVSIIVNLCTKKRADRITYIRGFKKGKGALIYFFAVPLYWIGINYGGATILDGFFGAVRRTVDLIVLKYDLSPVQALIDANLLYAITVYLCFVLVGLNAIMFAISLASQSLWKWRKNLAFKYAKGEKLMIFGNNEQNYDIYNSEKVRAKILVDKILDKGALSLYMKNIAFVQITSNSDYIQKAVDDCVYKGRKLYAVINTGDDDQNIRLGKAFINAIDHYSEEEKLECFERLHVYVFGDPRYETIYENIVKDGYGCITYLNKYQKIAIDFVDRYPFTRFMSEEHVDYDTSFVKSDVDINAIMIGFGKTNQQIFLTSVANNQFIHQSTSGVELKKVKYHIFDKNPAENNKNLNHNYNRYKNECSSATEEEYLPLPQYPAEENFYRLDVNDVTFYNEIRRIIDTSKRNLNFIIIAFGTDLENIDLAQKLIAKAKEWGVENLTVFVKARKDHGEQSLVPADNCYFIGRENETVYDIENILGDNVSRMAKLRNEIYDVEAIITENPTSQPTEEEICQIKAQANKNWYVKKSQMERESSLYCCLSLRAKLNMMGLDYVTKSAKIVGLTEEEYLDIYAKSDKPDTTYYNAKADGKSIVHYTIDFKDSRRKNMAIHEHLRWNSFMISKGTIPATKEQILTEEIIVGGKAKKTNGKNYSLRRHGNLTTFDGLVEFRQMIAKRDGAKEESKDVIKYDYQILDDAYWLLEKTGYKIVRR